MKKITLLKSLFVVMVLSLFSFSAMAEEVWTLVTDASTLAVGDKVIVVANGSNVALSTTQNNNNRGQVTITKTSNTVTINESVQVLTLEVGNVTGTFAFNTGSGYLYAASGSSNHLKTKSTLDDNGSWKIEVASNGVATIKAQGDKSRNWMRYNSQSALFSCYASGQADICLYKAIANDDNSGEEGGEEPEPTPDPEEPVVPEGPVVATIAEFLAAEVSADVWYELTGVVSNIVNTTFGNFDLVDATGTIYIYGLTKTQVSSNDKSFASLGLAVNDTVTIRSVRGEHNGTPQGGGQTTPAYLIAVSKYVAPEGGEGTEEPTPDPEEPEVVIEYVDAQGRIVYPFANHSDFATSWTSAYEEHTFDYIGAKVSFESADKNSQTITDIPVTKGKYVQLELKDANKAITSVRLVCRQWGSKAQTIKLNAGSSVDGLTAGATSSNFILETDELPTNTSVIRFTFSSANQIGIDSIYYTIADKVVVAVENPTISVEGGVKEEAFDVELACATDGAEIYYTLNGGAETKYEGAINIATTTTLTAWAVKGEDKSAEVTATYTFVEYIENATIAQVLAAEVSEYVWYKMTGVIYDLYNTEYGNFYLTNETDTILVYGLTATKKSSNDKSFSTLGLKEGDKITIWGTRSAYNGKVQVGGPAYFVEKVTAPAAPVISIKEKGGVTFSCETEGAKIMYAFVENGEELAEGLYQEYTSEELKMNNGDYSVYAYAEKDGLKSEVVSMRLKFDNGVAVGAEVVAIAEIFVQNRTIVTEGEFQIYTVTGQNVTEMNGALANGVYVVRSANAIAKVVVR